MNITTNKKLDLKLYINENSELGTITTIANDIEKLSFDKIIELATDAMHTTINQVVEEFEINDEPNADELLEELNINLDSNIDDETEEWLESIINNDTNLTKIHLLSTFADVLYGNPDNYPMGNEDDYFNCRIIVFINQSIK